LRTTAIAEVLAHTVHRLADAGIEEAHLESEILIAHTLGADRAHLLARLHDALPPEASAHLEGLVARRLRHEPVAYITGHREFYGLDFECSPDALIPRPETELLVEIALDEIHQQGARPRVADVGCGTGAVAIALAANAPDATIVATDTSLPALRLARRNAARHGVRGRIVFCRADLLAGTSIFDIVVANLPYVSEDDWPTLAPEIRDWEPRDALVGGRHGPETVERLIDGATRHLAVHGCIAIEIGDTQAESVMRHARARFPEATILVRKDLAGLDRAVVIRT
jgi:release factor glutamine methyltransferase